MTEVVRLVDILTFFEKFKDIIQTAIDSACHVIHILKDAVAEATEKALQDLKKAIKLIFKNFMISINELRQQAAAADVDVTRCIKGSEDRLFDLRQDCLYTAQSCLNGIGSEANIVLRNAMDSVQSLASEVTKFGRRLQDCKKASEDQQEASIAKLKSDIVESMVSLPLKISSGQQSIKDYVNKLVCAEGLPRLEKEIMSNFKTGGGAIVAKLTQCVNKSVNRVKLSVETQTTEVDFQ